MSRRWRRALVAGTLVSLVLIAAALLALRTGRVARFIRAQALAQLRSAFVDAHLGDVELTAGGETVLRELRLGSDAQAALEIPVLRISLAPLELLRGRLVLSRVVVIDPRVHAIERDGRWTLPGLRGEDGGPSAALPIEIETLIVQAGEVVLAPDGAAARRIVLANLEATASFRASGAGQELRLLALSAAPRDVGIALLRLTGAVRHDAEGSICVDDLRIVSTRSRLAVTGCLEPGRAVDARLALEPLDPAELRALFPASPVRTSIESTIDIHGPWSAPRIRVTADLAAAGTLRGQGAVAPGRGRPGWRGRVAFSGLDPEALAGATAWQDLFASFALKAPADRSAPWGAHAPAAPPSTPLPDATAPSTNAVAPPQGPAPRQAPPSTKLSGRSVFRGAGWGTKVSVSGRVVLDPSLIAGHPVAAAWIRGRHDARRSGLKARVRAAAGRAALVLKIGRDGEPGYDAHARLRLEQAELLIPPATGAVTARVAVRGSGSDPRTGPATVQALVRDLSVRGAKIAVARATAQVENGDVRVRELVVRGPELEVEAAGHMSVATREVHASGRARIALASLGPAGRPLLRGDLSGQGEVHGRLDGLAVRAQVEGRSIGGRARDIASFLARNLASDDVVEAGALRLTLMGRGLGGEGAKLSVAASGSDIRLGRIARSSARIEADWQQEATADRARLVVTAGHEVAPTERIRANVWRRAESTDVDLQELLLTPTPETPIRLLRPARIEIVGDHVRLAALAFGVAAGEQRLMLDGRFALHGSNDGVVVIEAVELAPLCRAGGLSECRGRLAGRLRLRGTAAAPEIAGRIVAGDLGLGTVDCGSLDVAVDYEDATLRAAGALRAAAAGDVDFDARVPVDLSWDGPGRDPGRIPLSVVVESDGLDLRLLSALAHRDIRDAGGRVRLEVRLDGTRAAPRIAGRIQLAGGWIQPAAAAVAYTDIEATVVAEGARLSLVELRARGGNGTLEGGGAIDLDGAAGAGALALDLRLHDFLAVRTPTLEAAIGGSVRLRGRLDAPVLTGALDVSRLVLRPVAIEALSAAPLPAPDATIEVVGSPAVAAPETEKAAPSGLDPLHVALDLRLAGDAWVRSPEASIELGGAVHIEKPPYEALRVTGEITLLRGWYAFQGRRFTVKQGTLTLPAGGGDSQLDVTGVYRVRRTGFAQSYDVFVTVRGPSAAPELTFSSEPPLEEGDILSVLLFGKTMDELTAGQAASLQGQTARLAGQYVIGELGDSVRDGLGLDTVEVELPEGQQGTGRVMVGRYVTRDVLVSLGHEFGSTVAEVFGVEYGITPSISVRGSTSTEGRSAVDLFWRRRY